MRPNKHHTSPKKLEDIPPKKVFNVPEGYFDTLPGIIQAKAIESTKPAFIQQPGMALKWALPLVLLVLIAGYYGFKLNQTMPNNDTKIAKMLDEVSTSELVAYIEETDLTTDEILEVVSFEDDNLEDFTYDVNDLSDQELDLIMDDILIEDITDI